MIINRLRQALGLRQRAPGYASKPTGTFEVRGRRCVGDIEDPSQPKDQPMQVQLVDDCGRVLSTVAANHDPNRRRFTFSIELGDEIGARQILNEKLRIFAESVFGLTGQVRLTGASQLALIREHMNEPSEIMFDLDFTRGGNAAEYMREGWSGMEPLVCCSDGPRSVLEVPQATAREHRYELTISGHTFNPPIRDSQVMELTLNGVYRRKELDKLQPDFIRFEFAAGTLPAAAGTRLVFDFPHCWAPVDFGINGDKRQLAFAFKQLTFARMLSPVPL